MYKVGDYVSVWEIVRGEPQDHGNGLIKKFITDVHVLVVLGPFNSIITHVDCLRNVE